MPAGQKANQIKIHMRASSSQSTRREPQSRIFTTRGEKDPFSGCYSLCSPCIAAHHIATHRGFSSNSDRMVTYAQETCEIVSFFVKSKIVPTYIVGEFIPNFCVIFFFPLHLRLPRRRSQSDCLWNSAFSPSSGFSITRPLLSVPSMAFCVLPR